jgi:heptosyltransferase-2
VGDAILSLPLIAQLATEYAKVDVLATPAVAAVYACCPHVSHLQIEAFRHGQLQWSLRRAVARKLKGRYTTAVVCPNSLKSALVPWLAGIPCRRGVLGEHRYLLLNDRRPALAASTSTSTPTSGSGSGRPSMLAHYLMLADQPLPAAEIDAWHRHRPALTMPANASLINVPTQQMISGGLLALCPGAEYGPAKQWPAAEFAAVANAWLAKNTQHIVAIVGGPKDQAIAADIVKAVDPALAGERLINLCGKTELIEAFAWIAKARCVVSNDSGLMHAAAAFNVPVAAIFGSTDPHHTPPHSPKAEIFSLRLSCSPCFKRVCPLGTTACLRDLPSAPVIDFVNTTSATTH